MEAHIHGLPNRYKTAKASEHVRSGGCATSPAAVTIIAHRSNRLRSRGSLFDGFATVDWLNTIRRRPSSTSAERSDLVRSLIVKHMVVHAIQCDYRLERIQCGSARTAMILSVDRSVCFQSRQGYSPQRNSTQTAWGVLQTEYRVAERDRILPPVQGWVGSFRGRGCKQKNVPSEKLHCNVSELSLY